MGDRPGKRRLIGAPRRNRGPKGSSRRHTRQRRDCQQSRQIRPEINSPKRGTQTTPPFACMHHLPNSGDFFLTPPQRKGMKYIPGVTKAAHSCARPPGKRQKRHPPGLKPHFLFVPSSPPKSSLPKSRVVQPRIKSMMSNVRTFTTIPNQPRCT
jgi:hypothetical protein